MSADRDEALRRMSVESSLSPDLCTDPRAVKCNCGALLYPGQICTCRFDAAHDKRWTGRLVGSAGNGWDWRDGNGWADD